MRGFFNSISGALFLEDAAFEQMRMASHPFWQGLLVLIFVHLISSAFIWIGNYLQWTVSPDLIAAQAAILQNLQAMSFYQQAGPAAQEAFRQYYSLVFPFFPSVFGAPPPENATWLIGGIFLLQILIWLVFSLVAYIWAKALGGTGNLAQTYGVLSLASAPYLLNAVRIVPFVALPFWLLPLWSFVANFIGLKISHELSVSRAFWATVLPILTLVALGLLSGLAVIVLNLMVRVTV
ncbi:MAG: hypothetical protein EXR62_14975 [Chloroflexi bacterium]|nr:hypothetical protein [Chloroflexota bacterium]